MSIERYVNRKFKASRLLAKVNARITAEMMAILRETDRLLALQAPAARVAVKPSAVARCLPRSAHVSSPSLVPQEAASSIAVGGSLYDRMPVLFAGFNDCRQTSAAARRMNVRATDRQVSMRRERIRAGR